LTIPSRYPDQVVVERIVAPAEELPLGALLHRVAAFFAADVDRRLAASEFSDLSLAPTRNVLRHLGDGPLRASQIVDRCEVSKQAVSQQIAHLERAGYLSASPDPRDLRARILTLTERGARALVLARLLFAEIEQEWARQIGAEDMGHLHRSLARLLERLPDRPCRPASPTAPPAAGA
jgi:DNA-binding MarR family transcriptional regulator